MKKLDWLLLSPSTIWLAIKNSGELPLCLFSFFLSILREHAFCRPNLANTIGFAGFIKQKTKFGNFKRRRSWWSVRHIVQGFNSLLRHRVFFGLLIAINCSNVRKCKGSVNKIISTHGPFFSISGFIDTQNTSQLLDTGNQNCPPCFLQLICLI